MKKYISMLNDIAVSDGAEDANAELKLCKGYALHRSWQGLIELCKKADNENAVKHKEAKK